MVALPPPGSYRHFLTTEDEPVVLAALLAAVVVLAILLAGRFAASRRATPRSENLGTVSERWLAVHRTEHR
jgi:hypothetical protein